MREKIFFACMGTLAAAAWVACMAMQTTPPPQLLIVVCSLGLLRLSKSAAVGGACLAGLIWDAFDWQVRFGSHSMALGLSVFLLSGIQTKLEVSQPTAWPSTTAALAVVVTFVDFLCRHLLGVHDAMPTAWWSEHLVWHPLWLTLLTVALLPWRTLCQRAHTGTDAPVSLIPLFLE